MADILRDRFEALRATEFGRLDEGGHVYLDYTGSGLYASSQLRKQDAFLERHVLGNPHSASPASAAATEVVERTRANILAFFRADPVEYEVVFTTNASAALKLVGEAFPFRRGSRLTLLRDNHNSVLGIREYARSGGADVSYVDLTPELRANLSGGIPPAGSGPSLFAFPAQSNFSGVKHPLSLVEEARRAGYDVLLDAAAFVPTSPLDISAVRADFACVSFYKMFGYPTGVGALLARREALARLERPWFAGGTVEFVSVQRPAHRLRMPAEAFEDGTLNFLGIAALPAGLEFLHAVGMEGIQERVGELTGRLLDLLADLRHDNGSPACEIYGPATREMRGGTVSFNLLDRSGRAVPYAEVERAASARNISLRGGCFCNPGAAEVAFRLPVEEAAHCFQAMPRGEFTLSGFASCLGENVPVGALRASLGVASNERDLERLGDFLRDFVRIPAEDRAE
ncbi:MAG: aminotransferase class V-fold PLP-dependent enzyme [Gemmatimonadetes bacterium]|nr:aminotransferase class V-fold PLP-dependent enzyme [Gemmatimonadota bacterium]